LPIWGWREAFCEEQHEGSNALHARTTDGRTYMLGRRTREPQRRPASPGRPGGAGRHRLATQIARNPYWSIAARAVELIHASASALDIVESYKQPTRPLVSWTPRAARRVGARRRRRGPLLAPLRRGRRRADPGCPRLSPPRAEPGHDREDLRVRTAVLSLPQPRPPCASSSSSGPYDPCISCATHFSRSRSSATDSCAQLFARLCARRRAAEVAAELASPRPRQWGSDPVGAEPYANAAGGAVRACIGLTQPEIAAVR